MKDIAHAIEDPFSKTYPAGAHPAGGVYVIKAKECCSSIKGECMKCGGQPHLYAALTPTARSSL